MILKASQRGGASQLGAHLLKEENEHVELHEIRGFMADDVMGAMKEAQAVARGTRCKQFLFSVSLNPPAHESVSVDKFESAIERIEKANGLEGQPRIVVFHTKEARLHAHCVWSRIDAETMTARPLSHFKLKLREISKQLYSENQWLMPRGLVDSKARDPRNLTLAEWQQAKRTGRDPRTLKGMVQECWAASDNGKAFAQALEERGLYLAKGDRRGHVAVTYEGEVLSVSRLLGKRAKDLSAKFGQSDALRSVSDARAHIASVITPTLKHLIAETDRQHKAAMVPLDARRIAMRVQHSHERQRLDEGQRNRATSEAKARSERLRPGVAGIWDRLTGRHAKIIRQNETDAFGCFRRDRDQRGALIADQLSERRVLQRDIVAARHDHAARKLGLHRDLATQQESSREADTPSASFNRAVGESKLRRTERTRETMRERGPELGR